MKYTFKAFGHINVLADHKTTLEITKDSHITKNGNCIILTDLDKQGKELYGKLNSGLQQFGVKVDNNFRNFLFKNTKLRQIEGLTTYIENNYNKINNKNKSLINE